MKTFLVSLCFTCVAYGILSYLPLEKGTGKMTRFICAICFLISVCNAVSGVQKQDISFSLPVSSEIEYSLVSNEAFGQAVGEMLKKENISYKKISIDSSENETGSISINEIAVYGVAEKERCINLIRENTGLDKEVRVYE